MACMQKATCAHHTQVPQQTVCTTHIGILRHKRERERAQLRRRRDTKRERSDERLLQPRQLFKPTHCTDCVTGCRWQAYTSSASKHANIVQPTTFTLCAHTQHDASTGACPYHPCHHPAACALHPALYQLAAAAVVGRWVHWVSAGACPYHPYRRRAAFALNPAMYRPAAADCSMLWSPVGACCHPYLHLAACA
jgi:hypothetical protein